VVEIFAFLNLEQNSAFFKGLSFTRKEIPFLSGAHHHIFHQQIEKGLRRGNPLNKHSFPQI